MAPRSSPLQSPDFRAVQEAASQVLSEAYLVLEGPAVLSLAELLLVDSRVRPRASEEADLALEGSAVPDLVLLLLLLFQPYRLVEVVVVEVEAEVLLLPLSPPHRPGFLRAGWP